MGLEKLDPTIILESSTVSLIDNLLQFVATTLLAIDKIDAIDRDFTKLYRRNTGYYRSLF